MPRWQSPGGTTGRQKRAHSALFQRGYCWARAMLNERYQDYDATASVRSEARNWRKQAVIYGVTPVGHQPGAGCAALHSGAYLMKCVRISMTRWTHFAGVITGARGRHGAGTEGKSGACRIRPLLPHGLQVELPDIPTTTTVQTSSYGTEL